MAARFPLIYTGLVLLLTPIAARADWDLDAARRDYAWAQTTHNSALIDLASNRESAALMKSLASPSVNFFATDAYRKNWVPNPDAYGHFEEFQKEMYAEIERKKEIEDSIRAQKAAQNRALDAALQSFFGGPELPDFNQAWQNTLECDPENDEVKVLRAYMTMTGQGTRRDTEGGRRELERLCGGFEKVPQFYVLKEWLPRSVARYLMGKTLCEGVFLPEDVELGFKYLLNTQLLKEPHVYCDLYWTKAGPRLPILLKRLQLRELADRKAGFAWNLDPVTDADIGLNNADPATKLNMAIYRADVEDSETQTRTRTGFALLKIRSLCEAGYEPAIMEMVKPGPTGHYFDLDTLEAADAAFARAYPLLVAASAAGDKYATQALSDHNNGIQIGLVFSMYRPGDDGETFFATHQRTDLALGMGWLAYDFGKEDVANKWFDLAQTLPVTAADTAAAYDRAQLFLHGRSNRPQDDTHARYWLKVGSATDPRCRELLAPYEAPELAAQQEKQRADAIVGNAIRSEAEAKARYLAGSVAWMKLAQTVVLPPLAQLKPIEARVEEGEALEEQLDKDLSADQPRLAIKTDYRALEIFAIAASKGSFYGALHLSGMLHQGKVVTADEPTARFWGRVAVRLALQKAKQGDIEVASDYGSRLLGDRWYPMDVEGGFKLLRVAAQAGDSSAAGVLSSSYRDGCGPIAPDAAKAAVWEKISELLDGGAADIAKAKALMAKN